MSVQFPGFNQRNVESSSYVGKTDVSKIKKTLVPKNVKKEAKDVKKISGKIDEINNNSIPLYNHSFNKNPKAELNKSENVSVNDSQGDDEEEFDLFGINDAMIEKDTKQLEAEQTKLRGAEVREAKNDVVDLGINIKIGGINTDLSSMSKKEAAEIKEVVKAATDEIKKAMPASAGRTELLKMFSDIEKHMDKILVPKMEKGNRVFDLNGRTQFVQAHTIPHEDFVRHHQNNETAVVVGDTVYMNPNMPNRGEVAGVAIVQQDGSVRDVPHIEDLTQEEVKKFSEGVSKYIASKSAPIIIQRQEDPIKKEDKEIVHEKVVEAKVTPVNVKNGRSEFMVEDHKCTHISLKTEEAQNVEKSKDRNEKELLEQKAEKTDLTVRKETREYERHKEGVKEETIKNSSTKPIFSGDFQTISSIGAPGTPKGSEHPMKGVAIKFRE